MTIRARNPTIDHTVKPKQIPLQQKSQGKTKASSLAKYTLTYRSPTSSNVVGEEDN